MADGEPTLGNRTMSVLDTFDWETPAWEPAHAYTWVRVRIREVTGRRTAPA